MNLPCPHGNPAEEHCPECEIEESLNAVGAANAVLCTEDLLVGEEINYLYEGGRAWCEDEYMEYLNSRRNAP